MRSNYVIILVTSFIVVLVISLAFYLHDTEEKTMLTQFQDHQLLLARLTASKIKNSLDDRSEGIIAVSHLSNLQSKNKDLIKNFLDTYFLQNKGHSIESATICNNLGTIIYSTNKKLIGNCLNSEVSTRFHNSQKKREIYVSSLRGSGKDSLDNFYFRFVLATPIYKNYDKKPFGFLIIAINLKDLLNDILKSINVDSTGTNAWIMDEEGTLIYSTDHPEMTLNSIKNPEKYCYNCHNNFDYSKTIIRTDNGVIDYKLKNYPHKLASFAPMQYEKLSWHVIVNTPVSEITATIDHILNIILILLSIVISTFIFGSFVMLRNNIIKVKAIAESKRLQEKIVLEKKIEESERHYKSLVEYSPEAIVVHSEGKIVFVNNAALKLLGASSEEYILDRSIFDFVHPESRDLVKKRVQKMAEANSNEPLVEEKFIKLDGTEIDVAVAAIPFIYKSKPAIHVVGRDISESKRIQDALRESEEKFRQLAEETPNIIFIISNGKVVYVNRKVEEVLGYKRDELYSSGFNLFSVIVEEYKDGAAANLQAILSGYDIQPKEYKLKTKKEELVETIISTTLINYNNDKAVLGIITDISHLKQIELQLRESESRYHTLFDNSPFGVFLIDESGNFVDFNNFAHNKLGYSREEFIKLKLIEVDTSGLDEISVIIKQLLIDGKMEFDAKYREKDGGIIFVHVNCQVILLSGQTLFHSIWEDITERRKAEKELERHRLNLEELVHSRTNELDFTNKCLQVEIENAKQLELKLRESLEKEKELSSLRSQFISTASHEFRTPLTIILSSADLLEIHQQEFKDEKYSKYISKIQNSVASMTELLDEVLTINRAESGKMKFEPQNINLYNFCTDIVNSHKEYAGEKHKIEVNYKDKITKVKADPKIISGILNNLITNAIKYSPGGGNIIISVSVEKEEAVFEVKDPGIGIEQKDINHIFTPFYRGGNVNDIKGSGLGLSIVQKSAFIHGGSVSVKSKKGEGSVFSVKIKVETM